jgi:release factor glutamine methyltransferase
MVEEASGCEPGPAPAKAARHLEAMVQRRLAGEPLQYVLGSWAFRHLELMVDRRVLIPRPETERVVDYALAELDRVSGGQRTTVVDLGTGSGAIALALAQERAFVDVWATDVSSDALAVARANLAGLAGFAATRVRMVEGSWFDALPAELRGRVDLVVSNPPYISTVEMAGLDAEVRDWEPVGALAAGPLGTEAVDAILSAAAEWLTGRGAVVIEVAPHQADRVIGLAHGYGFSDAEVKPDLTGRGRALVARR